MVLRPAAVWLCRHAGYGLGFERMVMYLTGIANIRDTLPHPGPWATRSSKPYIARSNMDAAEGSPFPPHFVDRSQIGLPGRISSERGEAMTVWVAGSGRALHPGVRRSDPAGVRRVFLGTRRCSGHLPGHFPHPAGEGRHFKVRSTSGPLSCAVPSTPARIC